MKSRYRIKERHFADGSKRYWVQRRGWFGIWWDAFDTRYTKGVVSAPTLSYRVYHVFDEFQLAADYIASELKRANREELAKCVSFECNRYPPNYLEQVVVDRRFRR